jgi:hypothetical protein
MKIVNFFILLSIISLTLSCRSTEFSDFEDVHSHADSNFVPENAVSRLGSRWF